MKTTLILLALIAALALGWLVGAALLMLAIGIIHAHILPAVLPVGLGPCVPLWGLFVLAFGAGRVNHK